MRKSTNCLFVAFTVCVTCWICIISAKETTETEGINTGYVIAFGRYIESPYRVTLKADTVYINGIQFEPRPKEPVPEPEIDQELEEVIRKEHTVLDSIHYSDWKANFGIERAQQMLREFLERQPLVKEFTLSPTCLVITLNLKYKGKDWPQFFILLETKRPTMTQEEVERHRREERLKLPEKLSNDLREGKLIAFGYGYTEYGGSAEHAEYRISKIREIVRKEAPDSLKSRLLAEKIGGPDPYRIFRERKDLPDSVKIQMVKEVHGLISDILKNQDSWR